MHSFESLNLSNPLRNAIEDLGFERPTPIQAEAFPVVLSGKDLVGIAQTGTGKTFAYMMPILRDLKFSKQVSPRVLVVVPTRELVIQVVDQTKLLTKYMNARVLGVYGGVNIKNHMAAALEGCDVIVATPGRLYDLILSKALTLKTVNKLVIDEVDVMLDLGFRFQLQNIFDLMPERRQNIMFSATMTDEVEALINDYFIQPEKISIAVSGTPLDNIQQQCYPVANFYTKVNLVTYLLEDVEEFKKVLVFAANKKSADKLYEALYETFVSKVGVIHSNKSQNHRIRTIEDFDTGLTRILVATDVIARGLDLDRITHVFNFDTPNYPENYMHRIGRTGRAAQEGKAVLFYTEKEKEDKETIELLMGYEIPTLDFPEEVTVSRKLTPEEQPVETNIIKHHKLSNDAPGPAFHEKKEKNQKENLGGSYKRTIEKKYKKPKTRGDKNQSDKNKRRQ